MFTQPIKVGFCGRRGGFDAPVLGFEDEGVTRGGEEDFVGAGTEDAEGEGGFGVVELDGG